MDALGPYLYFTTDRGLRVALATFDEGQVTSLAEIFTTTSDYMGQWLNIRASIITASDKTAILADITSYQAIEDDNVEIVDKEANFGARLRPAAKRTTIRNRIAGLIGWEAVTSGSRLVRS